MNRIRKGDDVVVIAGKSKGVTGEVINMVGDDKVLVAGANVSKKHQKPDPQRGVQGGIVDKEMPLHISNVALFNSATGKADRVGIKTLEDGRKVRIFKSNGEVVDA